jgi:type IV pilus assembly protein PilQ
VTPQITPDGNVIMDVDINKDSPGTNTTAGFAIDTKHVKTNGLIENGGTIVIGGIYTQDERSSVDKVPFLGDLPVLGNMFRSTLKSDAKTELLIFLTPRILDSKAPVNK